MRWRERTEVGWRSGNQRRDCFGLAASAWLLRAEDFPTAVPKWPSVLSSSSLTSRVKEWDLVSKTKSV